LHTKTQKGTKKIIWFMRKRGESVSMII